MFRRLLLSVHHALLLGALLLYPSLLPQTLAEPSPGNQTLADNSQAKATAVIEATAPPQLPLPDLTDALIEKLAGGPVTEPSLNAQYSLALSYLLPRIEKSGSSEQNKALSDLQAISSHASRPGSENLRTACSAAVSSALASNPSATTAPHLLRTLARIGDDQSIASIAPYLANDLTSLREEARAALSAIGSPAAAEALRAALSQETPPRLAAGILHSLGQIGQPEDDECMLPFLESENPVLREAALKALVLVGGSRAVEELGTLLHTGEAENKKPDPEIAVRLLLLASISEENGDKALAASVYQSLQEPSLPAYVRAAAVTGHVTCDPESAIDLLRSLLTGEDAVMQEAAVRAAGEIATESGVTALLRETSITSSNPSTTLAILRQFETRRTREALPEIRQLTSNNDVHVSSQAISILGKIGEAADLDLLLSLAASGTGSAPDAARQALARFPGKEVEATLKVRIETPSDDPLLRAEALRAAGCRSHSDLLNPALALLSSPEPALARAALESVSQLAQPEDISDLTEKLGDPESPAFPRLNLVLKKLCQTTDAPEKAVDAIIASTSEADIKTKAVGLGLLAILGTDTAFAHVSNLLTSETAEIRSAVLRSLSDWQSFEATPKLLEILRSTEYTDQERSQVLAGIARLVRTPDFASPEKRLAAALTALASAEASTNTKMLISSLATLPSPETIETLGKLLAREDVAKEAAAAIIQIAKDLPPSPEGKAQRIDLLQQALAVPGLPDSLRKKAQELVGSQP